MIRRVAALIGVALLADIAAWWLTRSVEQLIWVVAGAGGIYNVVMMLALVMILIDLWLPSRASPANVETS